MPPPLSPPISLKPLPSSIFFLTRCLGSGGKSLALVFFGLISVLLPNDRSVDKEGKVVILNPEGVLVDQEVQYSDFQFSLGQVEQIQTRELIKLIQSLSKDEDIPAVLLDFSGLSYSGPTNLIKISEEIQKLSELKRVIAFSDRYTTSSYLIAAHADEIYIHQAGGFDIQGIGGYRSYSKSLYENLKMKVYNYSQGDYKSAVEGLTSCLLYTSPSPRDS